MAFAWVITLVFFVGVCTYMLAQSPAKPTKPDVAADLVGKMVAVPDPAKPGQIVGWYFDKTDVLAAKIIDQRKEDHKDVYYVSMLTSSKAGGKLDGIAELYYVTIAGKQYLIAIGNINLDLTLPPPPKAPGNAQPAQKPPGGTN